MAVQVTPLESYELGQRPGFCERCCAWTAVAVDVGVVDGRELLVLNRYTSVCCLACGWEDITR